MSCLWIFIGLNFISKLHGYSHGNFPEVCDSMRPLHGFNGVENPPQEPPAPFFVSYQLGSNIGDPITVFLQSKDSSKFQGFMLEARNLSLDGDGPPLGKFIILDSKQSQLLKCGNSEGSAVSNRLNLPKSLIKVNWTAEGEEQDIIFRATFLQTYSQYWERVNVKVLQPTSTPTPETTPLTTTTIMPTTKPVITTKEMHTTQDTRNTTNRTEPCDITLMCLNSAIVEMKMQIPNIIMAVQTTTSSRHYLIKNSRIVGSTLSVLLSVSTLILFYMKNSLKDITIAPVCVVVVIGFIEWIIGVLPFGPSHELNEPCDLAFRVCFPFHHLFTNIFLHVRAISLFNEWGETRRIFWPLIFHTVFICLTIVWDIVLCANKRASRQKVKDKAKHNQGHQGKKECLSAEVCNFCCCSVTVAATLMVLITSLSVVIIIELFYVWNN